MKSLDHGANVINISGGEIDSSGKPHPLLSSAVNLCAKNGVLIVAAAGNDGCQCLHVPAAISSTLAVGAMDAQKIPLEFSNWGDSYQTNGILAAGEKIKVAVPGGGFATKSGTSFATPIVSGIVALLLSIQKKRGEKPDPNFIREAILQSAHSCQVSSGLDCRRYLAGSLNVSGAIDYITKKAEKEIDSINSSKQIRKNSTPGLTVKLDKMPFSALQNAEFVTIDPRKSKKSQTMASPGSSIAQGNVVSIAKNGETEMMNKNKEEEKMVETENGISDCVIEQEKENNTVGLVENICGCSESPAQITPSAVQAAESADAHSNFERGPSVTASEVMPSQAPPSAELVYALGKIGYDFGTEARRDAFIQSMETKENPFPNPDDPHQLLRHLDKHPEYAQSMIWTLDIEGTTVYAIHPAGTYSPRAYERLREFLREQITPVPVHNAAELNSDLQETEYLVEMELA
jgi:cyanobactin maturation PatA/PatG family protease